MARSDCVGDSLNFIEINKSFDDKGIITWYYKKKQLRIFWLPFMSTLSQRTHQHY